MIQNRDLDEAIEKGLCGAGRLKILRLLLQQPDHAFTRYEIGKTVPNDATSIRNDLQTLVAFHWVTDLHVQHLHKYAINREHEVVHHLTTFLKAIRYL